MAKIKGAQTNNRKLTDFFLSSQGPSSSQAPSSSQPSSSQKHSTGATVRKMAPAIKQEPASSPSRPTSMHRRPSQNPPVSQPPNTQGSTRSPNRPMQATTALRQNQTLSQASPGTFTKPRRSSPIRSVRKENAPPPRDVEVISISSSEAPTHISISSTSVISLPSSSVVDITPTQIKEESCNLDVIDLTAAVQSRRRSPRIRSREKPRCKLDQPLTLDTKRPSPRKKYSEQKRKRIASDDEAIDLDGAEEVVYAFPKPLEVEAGLMKPEDINLVTPAPSSIFPQISPRKRARVSGKPPPEGADIEIIPSSQSDERELTMPVKSRKSRKELDEHVRAWQASQELNDPSLPFTGDDWNMDGDEQGDMILNMEVECGWDRSDSRPRTPIAIECTVGEGDVNLTGPVSNSHPPSGTASTRQAYVCASERNSQLRTPARSSPINGNSTSCPPSPIRPDIGKRPTSSAKLPTPHASSSTSSTTKVEPLSPLTPPPKQITPKPTPAAGRRLVPEVLIETPRAKTARLIAKIKSDAFAAAASTVDDADTEQVPATIDSESELSSDPGDLFVRPVSKIKAPQKRRTTRASTTTAFSTDDSDSLPSASESPLKSNRRSKRLSSPTAISTISTSARRRSSRAPDRFPTTITAMPPPPPKRAVNPFAKLFKDKAAEQRFAPLRKSFLDCKLSSSDEEDDTGVGPPQSTALKSQPSMSSSKLSDEGDVVSAIGEADRKRLLGEDQDDLVDRILQQDRSEKGKKKADQPLDGISFWSSVEDDMEVDVDTSIPVLEVVEGNSGLDVLVERITARDCFGVEYLLQSAFFASPSFRFTDGFLTWLLDVALAQLDRLSSSANALLHHISQLAPSTAARASIRPVLKLLSHFQAKSDILDALEVQLPPCEPSATDNSHRLYVLKELAELMTALGKAELLKSKDVPVYIALLIVIGMDEKADLELKIAVATAVNALCIVYCGVLTFTDVRGEMERNICSKLLRFAAQLSSANKLLLLSFFKGAHPLIRRIGQWVAFSMLTGDYGMRLAANNTDGSPPLSDIKALLDPDAQTEIRWDLFRIPHHSEEQVDYDYVVLGHHAEILGHVLMNIAQYVGSEERAGIFLRKNCSFSSSRKSMLPEIEHLLERLSGRIVDTRAAHPDRSNTKASIQRVKMRLHFQCEDAATRQKQRRLTHSFDLQTNRLSPTQCQKLHR